MKKTNFKSIRWGTLPQIHIPTAIVKEDTLNLDARALKVYIALLYTFKNRPKKNRISDEEAIIFVRQYPDSGRVPTGTSLTERTGLSRRDVSRGIKTLKESGLIRTIPNLKRDQRTKQGRLLCQGYVLLDPVWGKVLESGEEPSVLFDNGIPYFTFPQCVVIETSKRWSLAKITGPEIRLYVTALWAANKNRNNSFEIRLGKLRKHSGLSGPTFLKAMDGLDYRGLIWASGLSSDGDSKDKLNMELCDPYTGSPLPMLYGMDENNPQNYTANDGKGKKKRLDMNIDLNNPEEVERFIRNGLGYKGPVISQGNGDITIQCPFHDDSTPSCSISPSKRGCFHCFGCGRNGSIFDLIKDFASATDSKVEFHDPDRKAVAKYSYMDANCKVRKQVLRYPDKDGQKVIRQRQPDKGGEWNWSVANLPPMLYHSEWLEIAGVVCLCEGEKDADTVFNLYLNARNGLVIGMTSGGANSWSPELAKKLRGKRVVILPDDDDAGIKYADAIEESLKAEKIEYHRVSFSGTGAKDVTEYMEKHSTEDLRRLIGADGICMPDGKWPEDPLASSPMSDLSDLDFPDGEITC
jgi:5S rRNA maturation endonuclease (ribonuclease M5)/biotin operon repressor